ncbi:polysaccharide deacetylase family protein [Candidatus Nomurabacteria bacterium]|nr:polysaccharide deacetylase family protein [Candidatus Nomurabacteria bacterium]
MSLSKKSKKFYIIFVILIIVVIVFIIFKNKKDDSYPMDAVASVVKTDTQKVEKVVENTTNTNPIEGYKVDKYYNVVPIDKDGNKKVVLLTIDDGPSNQSENLLVILAKHNVKAIFFINGMHDKDYKGVIKKEFDAGHAIGNHTWSHQNLNKIKENVALKEIESNTKLIADITGNKPKFFRSPFGISSEFSRAHLKKENMISMNWSGSTKDWEKSARDKKVFVNNVMKTLHDGEIILMHEHEWDTNSLDDLLTEIEKKGYTFLDPKNITK